MNAAPPLRKPRACVVLSAMALTGSLFAAPTAPAKTSEPGATRSRPIAALENDSQGCFVPAPASASAARITDDGDRISLDVLVLLDGLSRARGVDVMSKAAQAYGPLGVTLKSTFRRVKFSSEGEISHLFDELIKSVDGERPTGTDIVYMLTAKDLFTGENTRNYDIAGVAYCIGGVRYANAAFAMGEGESPWEITLDDSTFSAKIAAHEIGHVMGAEHHYGNCAEGDRSTDGGGEPSLCTIMWPAYAMFMGMTFGALESSVIRGHAVQFASP